MNRYYKNVDILLLVSLMSAGVYSQTPPDRDNGLKIDGANVCNYTETIRMLVTVTYGSQRTHVKIYRTCCFGVDPFCLRSCNKTKIAVKTVVSTRQEMKQFNRKAYYCCPGWKRDATNDTECKIPICGVPCDNGKCVKPGVCECKPGFHGNYCQLDNNECEDTNTNNCSQICQNTKGDFKCACTRGYRLNADGYTCDDINECLNSKSSCQCEKDDGVCQATCTNTDGSYICQCGNGYQMNSAERCEDINECVENDKLCDHRCINKLGGYECQCFDGFVHNSTTRKCTDRDECSTNNGGCSDQCLNLKGNFVCLCSKGKYLDTDRKTCKKIDLSTKKDTFCQTDDLAMLQCDQHNEMINITSAFYGRTSDTLCKNGNFNGDLKCVDFDVMSRISQCNGMPSCLIMMSFWDDKPCPGVEKYLNVVYKCIK